MDIPLRLKFQDIYIHTHTYLHTLLGGCSHLFLHVCARSVKFNSLQPRGLGLARTFCPWDFLEYCSRLPFPPPEDITNPGMEPTPPASPALAGRFFTTEVPVKSCFYSLFCFSDPRGTHKIK